MKTYQPIKTPDVVEDEGEQMMTNPRYDRNRNTELSRYHFMRNTPDSNGC
jgi:hypothetical protein